MNVPHAFSRLLPSPRQRGAALVICCAVWALQLAPAVGQYRAELFIAFFVSVFAGALPWCARFGSCGSLQLSRARRIAWILAWLLAVPTVVLGGEAGWAWVQDHGGGAADLLRHLCGWLAVSGFVAQFLVVVAWFVPCTRAALFGAGLIALATSTAVFQLAGHWQVSLHWLEWQSPALLGGAALVCAAAAYVGSRDRARRGTATMRRVLGAACVLAPFALCGLVVGDRSWADLRTASYVGVLGLSSDGRHALAWLETRMGGRVDGRIDLETGSCERLRDGAARRSFEAADLLLPGLHRIPPRHDLWCVREGDGTQSLYDLATGRWSAWPTVAALPRELHAAMREARRHYARGALPGGGSFWIDEGAVHFVDASGETVVPWTGPSAGLEIAGHGILVGGYPGHAALFDCVHRRFVQAPIPSWGLGGAFAVRGSWVVYGEHEWLTVDGATDRAMPAPWPEDARPLGLLGDDALLLVRGDAAHRRELLAWHPATGACASIPWTNELHARQAAELAHWAETIGATDPSGAAWLWCPVVGYEAPVALVRVDPRTQAATCVLEVPWVQPSGTHLLGFDEQGRLRLLYGNRIVQLDLATGEQTVLFPRAETR